MESPFLTADEVARRLKRNVQHVYRLVKKGKLPAHRFDGRYTFVRDEIDAFVIAQGTKRTASTSRFQEVRSRILRSLKTESTPAHSHTEMGVA
jgi:excisionase family DNA binding protein